MTISKLDHSIRLDSWAVEMFVPEIGAATFRSATLAEAPKILFIFL